MVSSILKAKLSTYIIIYCIAEMHAIYTLQEQELDDELELLVLASDGLWDVVPNEVKHSLCWNWWDHLLGLT